MQTISVDLLSNSSLRNAHKDSIMVVFCSTCLLDLFLNFVVRQDFRIFSRLREFSEKLQVQPRHGYGQTPLHRKQQGPPWATTLGDFSLLNLFSFQMARLISSPIGKVGFIFTVRGRIRSRHLWQSHANLVSVSRSGLLGNSLLCNASKD
jgi:hypothetical protein